MKSRVVLLLAVAGVHISTAHAQAQTPDRIEPFVVDVRVALPRFKEDSLIATQLGVASANLPTRGFGLVGGAHWYPAKLGKVTLGLGGEVLLSGAGKTADAEQDGAVEGPTVNTRFTAVSPQLSLNFGRRLGWSYLSGGIGWAGYRTEREDAPVGDALSRPRTFNYGGGARWFAREHLAFAVDLRFYQVSSQDATTDRPAYPSMTLMVVSAGVSFK